jgi:nitrite reductase/ring-hydroxylating ferredoxin subunit
MDLSGTVGLLELHCPHRGASLEYGLIGANGIRCYYHGWLFAVDGTILETPSEPAHSTLKDRLYHGAYPTHEYGGIVFAYMGPPDRQPPFPVYSSFVQPGYRLMSGQKSLCARHSVRDGGMGRIGVREFYAHQFLPNPSPDFDLTSLSQTFGNDRIVEEFVICFTHSLKMDWMLPGLPATGKRAEFVLAGIIQFQDGKVAHEHLYWIRPRFCTSWESWIIQYRRPELAVLRFF